MLGKYHNYAYTPTDYKRSTSVTQPTLRLQLCLRKNFSQWPLNWTRSLGRTQTVSGWTGYQCMGGEGLSVAKTAVDNLYREGPYYY